MFKFKVVADNFRCTSNYSCPIYTATGIVNYHGIGYVSNVAISSFLGLIWFSLSVTALVIYLFNPMWSRMYGSVPYFTSLRSLVVFFFLITGGFISLLQFALACNNHDWEAIGTIVGAVAAILGLRCLHWLIHAPGRLFWFVGLSIPTGSFMLSAIYAEIEEISRQAKIAYFASLEPQRDLYAVTIFNSATSFAVTAALGLLCFIVAFSYLSSIAYNFKFVTKFRSLTNVQRATVVMSMNCMLTGFILAVASGWQSASGFQPNAPGTKETLFLVFKWWCIMFIGSSSISPLFFAILERSSRLDSVITGLILAVFLSLVVNTLTLTALGVFSVELYTNTSSNSKLSDAYATSLIALFAFYVANAISILLLSIFFVGWRQLPDSFKDLPDLVETEKWGMEIITAKSGEASLNLNYILEDPDVVKVPYNQVTVLGELGSGGFGIVYLGVWQRPKTPEMQVAIKKQKFFSDSGAEELRDFMFEIKFLSRLHHPNILRFIGVVVIPEEQTVWLLTEYMGKGNLRDYMTPEVSEFIKLKMLIDVAEGMSFLHSHQPPILHRDLKAENVLISLQDVAKIADFGLTIIGHQNESQTITGSLYIIAPEVFRKLKYDQRVDIYSFGILAGELLGSRSFHQDLCQGVDWDSVIVQKILNGARPVLPILPEPLRNLIVECWADDPDHRPPFSEISARLKRIYMSWDQNGGVSKSYQSFDVSSSSDEDLPILSPSLPRESTPLLSKR